MSFYLLQVDFSSSASSFPLHCDSPGETAGVVAKSSEVRLNPGAVPQL